MVTNEYTSIVNQINNDLKSILIFVYVGAISGKNHEERFLYVNL